MKTAADQGGQAWEDAVRRDVGWRDGQCAPVGQDAAFAERLARKFVTTGGIVQAIEQSIVERTRSRSAPLGRSPRALRWPSITARVIRSSRAR